MDTETPQNPELSCGKFVYRGKELAYLNIGGEQMLSLAQLLSTFFPVTPRTTLFTRMEKIRARRHFCNAREIKLLKTVGGCHGSSANCTVIPKSDVENYCQTYLDSMNSPAKDVKEQGVEQFPNKEDAEFSPSKSLKSPKKNNKEPQPLSKSTKLNAIQEHNMSFKVKKRARKKIMVDRAVSNLVIKNKPQLQINAKTGNSLSAIAANEVNFGNIGALEESNGCNVTNSTQTPTMLNQLFKTKKFSKMKQDDRVTINHDDAVKHRKKRRLSSKSDKEKPCTPSKLYKCDTGNSEASIKKEFAFCQLAVSEVEKFEKISHNSSSSELRSPFSDVSSIDSGFSSTTSKKLSSTKSGMESKLDEVTAKDKTCNAKKVSPLNKTKAKRSPKKESERDLWRNDGNISLSPPALVIRRCENTWQVETKINKDSVDIVRKKLKLSKSTLSTTLKTEKNSIVSTNNSDKVISAQEAVEISNAVLPAKNLNVHSSPQQWEKNAVKKKICNVKQDKLECQRRNRDNSSASNTQLQCVEESIEENEGPFFDRGIFPMKRRRRRRSKFEMQEVRRLQALKKAAREAKRKGITINPVPITKLNIEADQNINDHLKQNTFNTTKRKKKKKRKNTSSEIKPSEDVDKKTSEIKQVSFGPPSASEIKSCLSPKAKPKAKVDDSALRSHSTEPSKDLFIGSSSTGKPEREVNELKNVKQDLNAPVKLVATKSSLNVNSKFKLNSLFNGFPMLTIQGGCLCPTYSHVYPKESKIPEGDHFLWKWHLGGPVIDKMNKVQFKTKNIQQKKTGLTSTNKVLAKARIQKAKQLAREKSKETLTVKVPTIVNLVDDNKVSCEKNVNKIYPAAGNSSANTNSTNTSTISNIEKSQSKPLPPVLNSVSKLSLIQKSSCLYSSVVPLDITTHSLTAVKTQITIPDFVENSPKTLSLSNQLQTIVAET